MRYSPLEKIAAEFGISAAGPDLTPSYNIAPTQDIVIVNNEGEKKLVTCRWGLNTSWAKDVQAGSAIINARAETISSKPSFRSAFRNRRCLIVADGFYEWRRVNKRKIPIYVFLRSGRPMAFAGLFNRLTTSVSPIPCSCTIITTESNDLLWPIHNRMPAIIHKENEDLWLDPDYYDEKTLLSMLRPYESEEMACHEVTAMINSPSFNTPDAIEPKDA